MIDDATHVLGNIYCWTDGERHVIGVVASDRATFVRWGAWPKNEPEKEQDMPEKNDDLTKMEIQVMWHLITGMSNKGMAAALGLSPHTVKFHVKNAIDKLGGARELAAVKFALSPENVKRARDIVSQFV